VHFAELIVQLLKSRFGFIQGRVVPPFIRGFMVKLFVTAGVDVFNRCVQYRLRRGRTLASARWI